MIRLRLAHLKLQKAVSPKAPVMTLLPIPSGIMNHNYTQVNSRIRFRFRIIRNL